MPSDQSLRNVIGIDVGGTKTLAVRVLVPESGRLVSDKAEIKSEAALVMSTSVQDRERVSSFAHELAVMSQIELAAATLIKRSNQAVDAIGVGLAGFIGRDGIARSSPNAPGLIGVNVEAALTARFGVPVVIDNDANCVALAAQSMFGTSSGSLLAVTLGTGIGGGMVLNGKLLRGAHGFAGEPGHMVINPNGPECPCGQRGCWERYASGSGLGWLGRVAAAEGRADTVLARAGSVEGINGEIVTELLLQDDPGAVIIFGEYCGYVALGLANLMLLFDPEVIVIGGGLAILGDRLTDLVTSKLVGQFPAASRDRKVRILSAPLGPEAGAFGAALTAAELHFGSGS
ncbi:MAG: ROK family protein [Microthrixaceae bacterium]